MCKNDFKTKQERFAIANAKEADPDALVGISEKQYGQIRSCLEQYDPIFEPVWFNCLCLAGNREEQNVTITFDEMIANAKRIKEIFYDPLESDESVLAVVYDLLDDLNFVYFKSTDWYKAVKTNGCDDRDMRTFLEILSDTLILV